MIVVRITYTKWMGYRMNRLSMPSIGYRESYLVSGKNTKSIVCELESKLLFALKMDKERKSWCAFIGNALHGLKMNFS